MALPEMNNTYFLAPDVVAAYQRDGHVLVRELSTAEEVAAWRPVLAAAVREHLERAAPLAERDTYHKAFVQVANLWERFDDVRRFVMARRFARVAAQLMGVRAVRLYHDQALYKEPGGGPTPWHQDMFYWPLAGDQSITMWMPLVDVSADMGSMVFASGTHRYGSLLNQGISDESEAYFERLVRDKQMPTVQYTLRAGDATFHAGWTLHKATPNHTDRMREVMTIIYFADGLRVAEPANANQPADLARWLPGCRPGDLAASPLNPIVYTGE